MTARQNTIIRILDRLDGCTSKLHLVKLAFLLSKESAQPPRSAIYEFVPYKYGPYSFTLYYDLGHLDQDGLIQTTSTDIRLVGPRKEEPRDLAFGFSAEIDRLLDQYSGVPVSNLVADVYRRYPWYTAKSDDVSKRAVKLPQAPVAVYKVGYENLMVDGLMDRLLRSGVERLIDVRCNPVARRFGFHKSTLQRVCTALGLEYVHIPDVAQAVTLMKSKPSALMCREADPACCHRTRLAQHVASLTGLPVVELTNDEAHAVSVH